jgi:plasmid stabilization system protein ParE
MVREVVWTEPAWQDLESAADFIARDSTSYAAAFVQEVKVAVASLFVFAERGEMVPEFQDRSNTRTARNALPSRVRDIG